MPVAGRQPKGKGQALWFDPCRTTEPIALLSAAALLDFAVGDPWGWPHPVQAMGWVIRLYSRAAISRQWPAVAMKLAGVGLVLLLVGGTGLLSAALLAKLATFSEQLRWAAETVLLASCFAGRSLRRAAEEVRQPLSEGDLAAARLSLARYVGRDTASLEAPDIYRALLETVSENSIDGVIAPLFYGVIGAFVGAAAPLALAYKAASTLDSMVGYRHPPYQDLGWCSARLEDILTWLPCRLAVGIIALLSGRPQRVIRLCQRDAIADPSPNSGWSECAYAAALGVQLGGTNRYQGKLVVKPLLGESTRPIDEAILSKAIAFNRWSFLALLGMAISTLGLVSLLCPE